MTKNIFIDPASLADFCQRQHIRKLALFGAVLQDDFCPDAEIDVLIEFELGQVPGKFRIVELEFELGELWRHKVTLRTSGSMSRPYRQKMLETVEVLYRAE